MRTSFAAKLVALEVATILVVSLSVAALLIGARVLQTRDLEQSVSRASAEGLRTDLETAGRNATRLASSLAAFPALRAELRSPDHLRLEALVNAEAALLPQGEALLALDPAGHPIVGRAGNGSQLSSDPVELSSFSGVPAAGHGEPGKGAPAGSIEVVGGRLRLDAVVAARQDGVLLGYVLDSQDLGALLKRLVRPGGSVQYSLFLNGRRAVSTIEGAAPGSRAPTDLAAADDRGGRFGVYNIGGSTYAGYYTRLPQADNVVAVAEVNDALFAAQRLNDILVVVFATGLLATVLSLLGAYFARRTALRPLAALSAGAERVKAGEYGTRVEVDSSDDFGRLARTFNEMSDQIRASTGELERQRSRLDASIQSLNSVSRALTATTSGEAALREAVLDSVVEMTSAEAVVMYEGSDHLRVTAGRGLQAGQARTLLGLIDRGRVLESGESLLVRLEEAPEEFKGWSALAVPMVYQSRSAGLLAAYGPAGLSGADIPALSVLANQAVVALQNSALFQRERETVTRLQELDGMKSDFFATIQHELRTPLTAIMGMTDLLDMAWERWDDAKKKEALGDVQVSAKLLYEIVETILDYSMLTSERVHLSVGSYGLREIAEGAIEELRPLIRRSDVKIDVRVPAKIKVKGDSRRLNQVMKALIDNAVKFSPEKARVLVRAEQENGRVALQVSDKGIGIAPEHQGQVFDRFFQVDNTATRRYGGTGMGLALVKQLVDMHAGKVSLESTPGKGSVFTVTLPSG